MGFTVDYSRSEVFLIKIMDDTHTDTCLMDLMQAWFQLILWNDDGLELAIAYEYFFIPDTFFVILILRRY